MDKREAIDRFTIQAETLRRRGKRYEAAHIDVCRECFILSYNFTLQDWKEVRSGDYFDVMDDTSGAYNKSLLKLNRIKEYLKTNK